MSKSRGNTTDPAVVIKESGADILRLWVALVDYAEDQRIGKQILQTTVDAYRKLRNTVRYLLGALDGFDEAERLPWDQMPPLEQFILHRLHELDGQVREAYGDYRFQDVVRPVLEFCSGDLSALYFDIRKDSLYCDRPDSLRRRAARTVMDEVFMRLTAWLAPLTPFTMEEAWTTRFPEGGSNCARVIPETPGEWRNEEEARRWDIIKDALPIGMGLLESQRARKEIGSALDVELVLLTDSLILAEAFSNGVEVSEVFRTSGGRLEIEDTFTDRVEKLFAPYGFVSQEVTPTTGASSGNGLLVVMSKKADHPKCARSWRRVPDVGSDPAYPDLSARDADAVRFWDAARG
jgi:isoleucyl-tRNA synthetase